MKLVEELYTALMMLRGSFAQLIPQDHSYTLGKKSMGVRQGADHQNARVSQCVQCVSTLKKSVLSAMCFRIP